MKDPVASVDAYMLRQPAASRVVLERVRSVIKKALPNAEERISYQIPAYKVDGRMVISFAGWSTHFSLYPVGDSIVRALGPALAPFGHSKGTLRFPLSKAVPAALITRIVKLRAAESAEAAANKPSRASAKKKTAKKKTAKKKTAKKKTA